MRKITLDLEQTNSVIVRLLQISYILYNKKLKYEQEMLMAKQKERAKSHNSPSYTRNWRTNESKNIYYTLKIIRLSGLGHS